MNTKPSRQLYVPLILIVALGLLSVGCGKKAPPTRLKLPRLPSWSSKYSKKTVPIYSEYVGQTKAEETVDLRARVEGILNKVYFREGMPVRKGQLLFSIEKVRSKRRCSRRRQLSLNQLPISRRQDNASMCCKLRRNSLMRGRSKQN